MGFQLDDYFVGHGLLVAYMVSFVQHNPLDVTFI